MAAFANHGWDDSIGTSEACKGRHSQSLLIDCNVAINSRSQACAEVLLADGIIAGLAGQHHCTEPPKDKLEFAEKGSWP